MEEFNLEYRDELYDIEKAPIFDKYIKDNTIMKDVYDSDYAYKFFKKYK